MSGTVLITGASTGIGKAAVFEFQRHGWNVAATMRSPEAAHDLAKLEKVFCTHLDVTDSASIKQAINETLSRFKSIDVLVNNAGYGLVGPFEASTNEQIERQFGTNVFGLMEVTRSILPHFRERRQGIILNVASIGGRVAFPLYSLYHATKWAVEGFSESLQHEMKPFNIKVKIIEPGPIKTDFYDRSLDMISSQELKVYDSFINKAMPNLMGAGATGSSPEHVARVIYKAATDGKWKLRYPAGGNAGSILFLRKMLPDSIFNGIMRSVIVR
jgi:short-subunit dehydrogenase